MNVKEMTKEELQEIPMVEIAFEVMKEVGKPYNYYDLFKEIAGMKSLTAEEKQDRISKLYTDMNIDGRFHSLGDNNWGLKKWYPIEQSDEEITTPVKAKKKAKGSDDEDFDDYEEDFDELEEELDETPDDEDDRDEDEDEEEDDFIDKDELDELEDEETVDDEVEAEDELD
ncbi:DNA-directed RNA polymerase subunit delta [bacterium LRH843]|nr:DNA-directed RNA polymerase subunit delta [bacterium LRH843]